ncbi:hypothetical protein AB0B89_34370 [Sphaerisporangium sp. NPDC049002]|uniref:hypothetical protein n=1 Tax=unclassified Sphaerisporangium TaxID=2630420 RepID=UPI0033EEC99D
MSKNLGGYQTITTVIKSLGGPTKATVIVGSVVATSGYAVLRGAEAGVKKVVKAALAKRNAPCATKDQVFEVISDGEDGSGLRLSVGDEYHVMECDGDAVQIEVLGDADNPYFVSAEFLRSVSGFPAEDADSANGQ